MERKSKFAVLLAVAPLLLLGPGVQAQDSWKFGLGTGFFSMAIDGDIAFADSGVLEIDLDNSDTSDLMESAFGFGGYAAKGKWRILYSLGRLTLEDDDGGLTAEWDRDQVEVADRGIKLAPRLASRADHGEGEVMHRRLRVERACRRKA